MLPSLSPCEDHVCLFARVWRVEGMFVAKCVYGIECVCVSRGGILGCFCMFVYVHVFPVTVNFHVCQFVHF